MYEPIIGDKQCSKCGKCLPLFEFGFDSSCAGGIRHDCNPCRRDRAKAIYNANKAAGIPRKRNKELDRQRCRAKKANIPHKAVRESKALWPIPTHTLTDSLSCLKLRAWRGPVSREPMVARL